MAKIALTVIALIIGVTLGIWPNRAPSPTPATVQSPARQAGPAISEPVDTPPPSATPAPGEAPQPIDSASPGGAQKPVAVNPPPGTPARVTVATVRENGPALQVAISWTVGSGNGRAITGHKVTLRTNRGYTTSWQTGASGDGGTQSVPCGFQVCDGMRVDAEVRAVSAAGEGTAGRGNLVYSAPYLVRREQRSDQGANNPAQAMENARNALPGLRASITANGVACTSWEERVISVYATPDGSWHIFAGIVSGLCKY